MHNLVAEFSSKIDSKTKLPKKYRVVSGSVFTECYNETLDNAVIVLSQIFKEDRLTDLQPYEYVRVYDENDVANFDKLYLIDSISERENNIKEHIFGYNINLMSETKLLEKIQCPNLTITHKVLEDGSTTSKTIFQKICEYMELFVPKIKYSSDDRNWSYIPLIANPGVKNSEGEYEAGEDLDFYNRFNVRCADFSLNQGMLRQVLTTLMQQVGCIPVVRNRKLTFLDFQLDLVPFNASEYTINYIDEAISSDSYANTLVNMSQNILDSENEVISETLGFRDSANSLLKQKENLFLETRFPIYKINNLTMHFFATCNFRFPWIGEESNGAYANTCDLEDYVSDAASNVHASVGSVGTTHFISMESDGHTVDISIQGADPISTVLSPGTVLIDGTRYPIATVYFDAKIYPYYQENGRYYNFRDAQGHRMYRHYETFWSGTAVGTQYPNTAPVAPNGQQVPSGIIYLDLRYDEYGNFESDLTGCSDALIDADIAFEYYGDDGEMHYISGLKLVNATFIQTPTRTMTMSYDITPLTLENSVRALTSVDFVQMNNRFKEGTLDTIEKLSQYRYGTVGFTTGDKKIEGFSNVYNIGSADTFGWITKEYTYIENMIKNFLLPTTYKQQNISDFLNISDLLDYYDIPNISPETHIAHGYKYTKKIITISGTPAWYNPNGVINYTSVFFDIEYQPLNSLHLSFTKQRKDIPYNITQLNNADSGLTMLDRLTNHQQEEVNRIGNKTLTIKQRTKQLSDIQTFDNGPIVFYDSSERGSNTAIPYTIFEIRTEINNNYFNVSYVGSEAAVLKDYFTSIITKYRAYQYVDYNASVLRKEKDLIFVRISEDDYYDGDDRIWFGNYSETRSLDNTFLLVCDFNNIGNDKKLTYIVENSLGAHKTYVADGDDVIEKVNEMTKNDLSIVSSTNLLALVYEAPDNVGNGTYIQNNTFDTSVKYEIDGFTRVDSVWIPLNGYVKVGGVPQTWQIWDEDTYNHSHRVCFTSSLDIYDKTVMQDAATIFSMTNSELQQRATTLLRRAALSPIVEDTLLDLENGTEPQISVVDDNTSGSFERTFYKDYAERINHTVQFIYYTVSDNIKWNEFFIQSSPFVGRGLKKINNRNVFLTVFYHENYDNFEINDIDTIYDPAEKYGCIWATNSTTGSGLSSYVEIKTDEAVPYILVHWADFIDVIRICYATAPNMQGTYMAKDVVVFRKPSAEAAETKFYLSLNDTQSDYVLSDYNGLLYKKHKVLTNMGLGVRMVQYLPNEYQPVSYIEATRTQYIKTGYVPNENTVIKAKFAYTQVIGSFEQGNGLYYISTANESAEWYMNNSGAIKCRLGYVNGNISFSTSASNDLNDHIIELNIPNNYCKLDNEQVNGFANNYDNSNNGEFVLFGATYENQVASKSYEKIYWFQIYENDVLLHDFIPCYRKADHVIGFYDTITDDFYTNDGTGTFIIP